MGKFQVVALKVLNVLLSLASYPLYQYRERSVKDSASRSQRGCIWPPWAIAASSVREKSSLIGSGLLGTYFSALLFA